MFFNPGQRDREAKEDGSGPIVMARARNIKPGFFTNEDLAECSHAARLLFCGLWCLADREGRLEDRPKRIKASLLPYDDADVDMLLSELEEHDFIMRYEVSDSNYIWITGFHKHQRPHHMEEPSSIPPPPGVVNKYNHSPVLKAQRLRIFARDGHKCVECNSTRQLQIDHIKPISKGGSSDDDNLRSLCRKCNESKGNREQVVIESTTISEQVVQNGSCPTDTLNLIPDTLNPQTDSVSTKRGRPSLADVVEYCHGRGGRVDPSEFFDFYEANGWVQGKGKAIKDWQAAVRNWERRKAEFAKPEPSMAGKPLTPDQYDSWNSVDGGGT